jgi:hypothetical protein
MKVNSLNRLNWRRTRDDICSGVEYRIFGGTIGYHSLIEVNSTSVGTTAILVITKHRIPQTCCKQLMAKFTGMEAVEVVQELDVQTRPDTFHVPLIDYGNVCAILLLEIGVPFRGKVVKLIVHCSDVFIHHFKFSLVTSVDTTTLLQNFSMDELTIRSSFLDSCNV